MTLPTPKEIQADIDKLIANRTMCEFNAGKLQEEIGNLQKEQDELRDLVLNPGYYDVDALKNNINNIGDNVIRIRGVIILEQDKIAQFDYVIEDLRERKCLSEAMLQLTGQSPLE